MRTILTSARELLGLRAEFTTHDLTEFIGGELVPEAMGLFTMETSPRVRIDVLKCHYFDHRRIWKLMVVTFDEVAVMIVQQGGREGRDHRRRFLLSEEKYWALVEHLHSLQRWTHDPRTTVLLADQDEQRGDLTTFYGCSLVEGVVEEAAE